MHLRLLAVALTIAACCGAKPAPPPAKSCFAYFPSVAVRGGAKKAPVDLYPTEQAALLAGAAVREKDSAGFTKMHALATPLAPGTEVIIVARGVFIDGRVARGEHADKTGFLDTMHCHDTAPTGVDP